MSRNRQDRLELEAAYQAALKLVDRIDYNLRRGIHYRTSDGALLTTLDEVIRAILTNDLRLPDEPAAVPLGQPVELVLQKAA